MLRVLVALIVASILGGAAFAYAASLDLDPGTLGAGDAIRVASVHGGVTVAYTVEFDATAGRYEVTHVTVNDIAAACNGKTVQVALTADAVEESHVVISD